MNNYDLLSILGVGSFGTVYKARHKQTSIIYAIKKFNKKYFSIDKCKELREVKSLSKLKHVNIIKLEDIILEDNTLFLVFELMTKNIYEHISSSSLKEKEVKSIVFQILSGLNYMHRLGYFHRDLKPENILINHENIIKIADFGLAREIRSIPPYTQYVSTRWYRSPECLLEANNYSYPVDIWAIGCITIELLSGNPIFPGNNQKDTLMKIVTLLGIPPKGGEIDKLSRKIDFKFPKITANIVQEISNFLPANTSQDAISFILEILKWEPNERPTASILLNHSFFQDINEDSNLFDITSSRKVSNAFDLDKLLDNSQELNNFINKINQQDIFSPILNNINISKEEDLQSLHNLQDKYNTANVGIGVGSKSNWNNIEAGNTYSTISPIDYMQTPKMILNFEVEEEFKIEKQEKKEKDGKFQEDNEKVDLTEKESEVLNESKKGKLKKFNFSISKISFESKKKIGNDDVVEIADNYFEIEDNLNGNKSNIVNTIENNNDDKIINKKLNVLSRRKDKLLKPISNIVYNNIPQPQLSSNKNFISRNIQLNNHKPKINSIHSIHSISSINSIIDNKPKEILVKNKQIPNKTKSYLRPISNIHIKKVPFSNKNLIKISTIHKENLKNESISYIEQSENMNNAEDEYINTDISKIRIKSAFRNFEKSQMESQKKNENDEYALLNKDLYIQNIPNFNINTIDYNLPITNKYSNRRGKNIVFPSEITNINSELHIRKNDNNENNHVKSIYDKGGLPIINNSRRCKNKLKSIIDNKDIKEMKYNSNFDDIQNQLIQNIQSKIVVNIN